MKKIKKVDAFNDSKIKVPFVLPEITSHDKKTILQVLNNNLLTDGPNLKDFENKFAKFTGAKYAIGVSNATAALQLSLKAIGIKKDDEVIVPDITFVATANSVIFANATPVIADVSEDDFNISLVSIEKSITKRTKAIIPVHFAGKPCQMIKIKKLAKKYNIKIIEDCAHAIGSQTNKKHVGTFGETGCFSFYPTKNLTTFEGGMVITNSKKIAEKIKLLRNHGIMRSLHDRFSKGKPWDYDVLLPGYNYRLDEIRSALGVSQLKRLIANNKKRQNAFRYYNSSLKKKTGVITPKMENNEVHSCHLYVLRIKKSKSHSRDAVFQKFLKNGIRSSVHYKPLHEFSVYKKYGKTYDDLSNSKKLFKEFLSLPLYPQITKKQQDLVINNL
jgi:perosamine synthetase